MERHTPITITAVAATTVESSLWSISGNIASDEDSSTVSRYRHTSMERRRAITTIAVAVTNADTQKPHTHVGKERGWHTNADQQIPKGCSQSLSRNDEALRDEERATGILCNGSKTGRGRITWQSCWQSLQKEEWES